MIGGLYEGSERFLDKAKALYPEFYETEYLPEPATLPTDNALCSGKCFTLDFGTHIVGYLTLTVEPSGTPGSPLEVVFEFAEDLCEYDPRPYTGGLASSWLQRATVYMDDPYAPIVLPRRYAFRYVRITFPANTEYTVRVTSCVVRGVTSADERKLLPLPADTGDFMRRIDETGCRTLKNCMQSVFEDGPKRDRRLWLGDLYLQAKANYYTYGNTALVRRCLYLFAGIPHPDGCLSSAIFQEPILRNQSWILHDYALFFAGTLRDLYEYEGDAELVRELWPVALRQAEIATANLSDNGLMDPAYYFVDWCAPLDKAVAAQGIAVAMLKDTLFLAGIAGDNAGAAFLRKQIRRLEQGLLSMYDPDLHLFRTPGGQLSIQSQMWGVLAGVLTPYESRRVLETVLKGDTGADGAAGESGTAADAAAGAARPGLIDTVTPYAKHYLTEALFQAGLRDEATRIVRDYWGAMVLAGADCFHEVFVPSDPTASPYGDHRVNSFCHAWSCTASYFIRRYGLK